MCHKTCIFCFFPIINKYLCMAKRSLLSRCPSYISCHRYFITAISYGQDSPGFESWQRQEIFWSPKPPRSVLGPTQAHIQCVSGFFPGWDSGWGVRLTSHLRLVRRLRISGCIPLLPLHALMTWTVTLPTLSSPNILIVN